jgi:2,3-dihydroxybiphenyl 1,2-dioxygenase
MSHVTELGYLGLSVSDLAAWREYAGKIFGMEIVDDGEGDRVYLRMDSWHHRIVLHADGGDDLAYVGWRVPGPVELEELTAMLEQAEIPVKVASASEAAERRVLGLIKTEDPGGNPTEIFYGPEVNTCPFDPGRPMFGKFVTGEQGLGHVMLRLDDIQAGIEFYRLLGFRGTIEYKIPIPGLDTTATPVFMNVNKRNHSVAFGAGPTPKRIVHLMIEYTELDDLGITHDAIRKRDIDVSMAIGKHANDHALTFYCANPSGWLWEPGWGGRSSLDQVEYYRGDIFGHQNEASGYGLDIPLT